MSVIGLLGRAHLPAYNIQGIFMLIYLAFLSAVSFTLWTILLKHNDVGKVTIYNFLIPIFGAVLSAIFLKESILEGRTLAALALVCIGIYAINKPQVDHSMDQ